MSALLKVAGSCPMGCGQTLVLGAGGYITCRMLGCPNPSVVDGLLHELYITDHVVHLYDDHFAMRHPLRERSGDLFDCPLHKTISAWAAPRFPTGRYVVRDVAGSYAWTSLDDAA